MKKPTKKKPTKKMARKPTKRDWRTPFLRSLAKMGVISYACKAAKIGRQTAYDRREKDEAFAQAWNDALEDGIEELEAEARRRALNGSDVLLMFLLKSKRPEVYREHYEHHHTGGSEDITVTFVNDFYRRPKASDPAESNGASNGVSVSP